MTSANTKSIDKYLPAMAASSFFKGLSDYEILSVLHCINASVMTKKKDEYIFHSGDTTSAMGLVLNGSALIIQEDFWGHRNIMSKCLTGDLFGEPYAATPGTVLNISVLAAEDCDILMINVNHLMSTCSAACSHHQRLTRNLVDVLSRRILMFNDKITHMSKRSTRSKLLSYLSAESLRQGKRSFDIPFDRQQLADYLCVERAAMSTELSKLKNEGLLDTNRNHFQLFTLDVD